MYLPPEQEMKGLELPLDYSQGNRGLWVLVYVSNALLTSMIYSRIFKRSVSGQISNLDSNSTRIIARQLGTIGQNAWVDLIIMLMMSPPIPWSCFEARSYLNPPTFGHEESFLILFLLLFLFVFPCIKGQGVQLLLVYQKTIIAPTDQKDKLLQFRETSKFRRFLEHVSLCHSMCCSFCVLLASLFIGTLTLEMVNLGSLNPVWTQVLSFQLVSKGFF